MLFDRPLATAALDYIGITPHDPEITHIDAVTHVFWEGKAYNGRTVEQVLTRDGLAFGSIHAQREGIFTRGVLLNVAAARHVPWLPADDFVTPADLEAAEAQQSVVVGTGDAVVVYVGRELRAAAQGPNTSPIVRAGLHASAIPWLHERGVAVYAGDCSEKLPYPSSRVPLPLHQIGLVSMGLCLLDAPSLADLVRTCQELQRWEFLIVCAAIDLPGATGAPVNPLAVF
jgi:kynurenine formamidase